MRRRLALLLVLLAVVGAGLLWLRGRRRPVPSTRDSGGQRARAEPPGAAALPGRAAGGAGAAMDPARLREARARRDELRAQILKALSARPAAPAAPRAAGSDAPRPPGHLTNRGVREALGQALNQDFMPLADECIERAQERSPGLSGMLFLGIETVADQDLGAVVDQANATARNEVNDPDLLECLRESAYSLRLPPPPGSGREAFEISLRVQPAGLDR